MKALFSPLPCSSPYQRIQQNKNTNQWQNNTAKEEGPLNAIPGTYNRVTYYVFIKPWTQKKDCDLKFMGLNQLRLSFAHPIGF
jgi:hypothetical protein